MLISQCYYTHLCGKSVLTEVTESNSKSTNFYLKRIRKYSVLSNQTGYFFFFDVDRIACLTKLLKITDLTNLRN